MQQTRRIFAIIFLVIGRQLRALDRALSKSARRLLEADEQRSGSRQPQADPLGAWTDGAFDPPEHWLERVQEGAPWLLDHLPTAEEYGYAPPRREPHGSTGRKARRKQSLPDQLSNTIRQVLKARPARRAPSRSRPASNPSRDGASMHESPGASPRPEVTPHQLPVIPPRRLRDEDREAWPALPDTTGAGASASSHPADITGGPSRQTRIRRPRLQPPGARRASEQPPLHAPVPSAQARETATYRFPVTPRQTTDSSARPGTTPDRPRTSGTREWPQLPEPQGDEFDAWPVGIRRWERLRRLDAEQRGEPWNAPPS